MVDMEILDTEYNARINLARRDLDGIVTECERAIHSRQRSDKSKRAGLEFINIFLGLYYSIEDKIKKEASSLNSNNGDAKAARLYSLYASSNAVLNHLLDDELDAILREQNSLSTITSLQSSDVRDKGSDYSLMSSVFKRMTYDITNYVAMPLKQVIFNFFDILKNTAKRELANSCSRSRREELSAIRLSKEGFNFAEINYRKKENNGNGRQKVATKLNDYLPTELPLYVPNPEARLELVVGNKEAIESLIDTIVQLLCYDQKEGRNKFYSDGCAFNDCFLIYGNPGVGKNFTVDAVLNRARELAERYSKDVCFVDIGEIKTIYKDGSAQMLGQYVKMERKNRTIYINVLDEANGVITVAPDGKTSEESKKVIGEFKKSFGDGKGDGHILTLLITNYTRDDEIESAIKRRLVPLQMKGPQTAEEFAQLLYNQLRYKRETGLVEQNVDWRALGKLVADYKDFFENENTSLKVVGSDVAIICAPLKNKTKHPFRNIPQIIGMSFEQHGECTNKIFAPITHALLEKHIKDYFLEKVKQEAYTMPVRAVVEG